MKLMGALALLVLLVAISFEHVHADNVALTSNGATCTASSVFAPWNCERAMDGSLAYHYGEWISQGEGVGSWILLTFDKTYRIQDGKIMQRFYSQNCNRMIRLDYDNGFTEIELAQCTGMTIDDESGAYWNDVTFDPPAVTHEMKITVLTVYSQGNNGFVEIEMDGFELDTTDVALWANGATCTASSVFDPWNCERAIDGSFLYHDGEWISQGEGVDSWILLTFDKTYRIQDGRIMQRFWSENCNREIRLDYDNGNTEMRLAQCTGMTIDDESGAYWNDVTFDPPAVTHQMKITVLTVYSTGNNGFVEIEMYGLASGETKASVCDDPLVWNFDGELIAIDGPGAYNMTAHPNPSASCYFRVTVTIESVSLLQTDVTSAQVTIGTDQFTKDHYFTQDQVQFGIFTFPFADYNDGEDIHAESSYKRLKKENGCVLLESDDCFLIFRWCPDGIKTCAYLYLNEIVYQNIGLDGLWGNFDGDKVNDFTDANGVSVWDEANRYEEMSTRYRITAG